MNQPKPNLHRNIAQEAFIESLDHLQKLPECPTDETVDNAPADVDPTIADWEEAGADLEEFFKDQKS
jgi:hypothetical protein